VPYAAFGLESFDEAQAAALWELSASLTGIPVETGIPSPAAS